MLKKRELRQLSVAQKCSKEYLNQQSLKTLFNILQLLKKSPLKKIVWLLVPQAASPLNYRFMKQRVCKMYLEKKKRIYKMTLIVLQMTDFLKKQTKRIKKTMMMKNFKNQNQIFLLILKLINQNVQIFFFSKSKIVYCQSLSINTTSPYSCNSLFQAPSFTSYLYDHVINFPYYTEKYEELCKLGQGAHSLCFKVRNRYNDKLFCAKVIRTPDQEKKILVENEYKLLAEMSHRNIVKVEEMIPIDEMEICVIIMEFINALNLNKIISKGGLPTSEVIMLAEQLLTALNYLKNRRVIHRDIKPSNLIWDGKIKELTIIDFGIGKQLLSDQRFAITPTGTANYKAPEILSESDYNEQVDVWGAGQVLLELVSRIKISSKLIIDEIDQCKELKFNKDVPFDLQQLIKSMLSIDPDKRPTPRDALLSPIFNKQTKSMPCSPIFTQLN